MNAIALLKADHRTVEELFDKLEGKSRSRSRKAIADKLVRELSIHTAIEEQVFYPAVRDGAPDCKELVLVALEEHNVIKWTLDSIESRDADDDRFDAKLKVLRDTVMRHLQEEEGDLFPKVQRALGTVRLNELGTALERAKKTAPTRPHPRVPDEPPANVIVGAGAAVIDRARDARDQMRGRNGHARRSPARARQSNAHR
jgi:hemerythrin superfamily protein